MYFYSTIFDKLFTFVSRSATRVRLAPSSKPLLHTGPPRGDVEPLKQRVWQQLCATGSPTRPRPQCQGYTTRQVRLNARNRIVLY